jgi:gluconokinase
LKKPNVLALDIGTSSVRAALYTSRGQVLPETMVKNDRQLTATGDGGAEIDAGEALDQVIKAVDEVILKSGDRRIDLVAASSFWHSLLGTDKSGSPTTKVFGWADTRSRKYVSKLRAALDESKTHNRTGARFHSSYWTAKLLWLRREQSAVFRRTARWLSLSDYLALRLFGKPVTSVSMASGTGIFNIRKSEWDIELLDLLKITERNLPEIVAADTKTFSLNEKYASRWPQLREARWFPAIGDGAANNIGANCLQKSRAALMIGTSGAMRVAYTGAPPRKIPEGLWCYRIDRSRVIMGGALSDGGGLYRWLKDNLKLTGTDDQIENQIERREPDSHGLTFLPFLAGERGTGYHESARGALLGLHSATDATDIVQAALESVAYRFAEIFAQLRKTAQIEQIIASGGALRESPVWTQIIADALGQNMSLPDTREASSRGAVLWALEAAGIMKDIDKLTLQKGERFKFNERRNKIYKQAAKRHQTFYELLVN